MNEYFSNLKSTASIVVICIGITMLLEKYWALGIAIGLIGFLLFARFDEEYWESLEQPKKESEKEGGKSKKGD